MADLEEGEIADSDSEVSAPANTGNNRVYSFGQSSSVPSNLNQTKPQGFSFSRHRDSPTPADSFGHRSSTRNGNSSDDSIDTSDEDSPLWNCKRTKYLNRLKMEGIDATSRSQSPQFINPLRDRHRASPVLQSPPKKKTNNIWGSVLQEQSLTQNMVSFGVDKEDSEDDLDTQDRSVESYNYKKAREDVRPFPQAEEDEMDRSDDELFGGVVDLEPDTEAKNKERKKRKRKRPVKDRIGERSDLDRVGAKLMREHRHKSKGSVKDRLGANSGKYKTNYQEPRPRPNVVLSEDDPVPVVVDAIVEVLDEPKVDLITRIVKRLGQKKGIQLLRQTEDVEDSGGMLVKDGSRRRSAGGVFLQLLKSDSDVTKADVDYIFEENDKMYMEHIRRKNAEKKERKRRIRQQKQMQETNLLARMNGETSNNNHDHHGNGVSMQMDPDHSNGFHKDSDDGSVSEGEITPDTSGERDHLDTGSHQGGSKSVVSVGEGEEDMLTITVDEEETIE
ncbi:phosphorylated adapter RNA export protein-like [Haliotis rubra]|uniref:phosphorylated adapter RNA export protein-like n=1 Tax=Haliotis rubra TaxID=36100 RepID=UPI001EE55E7E|nr:phosphorylated adapter RNA export protein-like [Haliotis rubra]